MAVANATNGEGKVALHRWFTDGEGWSYHPWFESRLDELIESLNDDLNSRDNIEVGSKITCRTMGGVLIGEHVEDNECPDPMAAGRHPSILRVVFLKKEPRTEDERLSILQRLAKVSAQQPGIDSELCIQVEPQLRADRRIGSLVRWAGIGFFLVLMISVFLVAAAQIATTFKPPNPRSPEEQRAVAKMAEMLRNWGQDAPESLDGDNAEQAKSMFFDFLSQQKLSQQLKGEHPDVIFLSRLPSKAIEPTPGGDGLRQALAKLAVHLDGEHLVPADGENDQSKPLRLNELLERIENSLDYEKWWNSTISTSKELSVNEPVAESVRIAAYRFIPKRSADQVNRSWEQPAAMKMIESLHNWKVKGVSKEDATKRPWFVIYYYFKLLSWTAFSAEDLVPDAWYVVFVRQLPSKPLTKTGRFESEKQLIDSLRELAKRIGADRSNELSTLLSEIREAMNYEKWRQRSDVQRESEKGSERINRFVERFRVSD